MNLKCKLFGHVVHLDDRGHPILNDSGYAICERCGSHEYYDHKEWGNLAHGLLRRVTWSWFLKVNSPIPYQTWSWAERNAERSHYNAPWDDGIPF